MKLKTLFILIMIILLGTGLAGPASVSDSFTQGMDSFNAGRWEQAASQFRQAASQTPKDEAVRVTAGVALANVKRYKEAAEQFRSAAFLSPMGVLPQLLLDSTYSEIGNQAQSRLARNQASSLISSGKAFDIPGSSDRILAASLVKYPQNAIAVCLMGDLYQLQGKMTQAKEYYIRASDLAPKWAKPAFNLGLADLESDPKSAEQSFNRAIALDPSNSRAKLWLGDAYLRQKSYDQAIQSYSAAGQDKTLTAEAQTRIGNAQMQAGNYKMAEKQFNMAQTNAPQDPRPVAGQAQALQNQGDLAGAENQYNRAAEIITRNSSPVKSKAVVIGQIAQMQTAQGRYSDASANFQSRFELQPSLENAKTLTASQQRVGLVGKSISRYEAVLKEDPKNIPAMLYLTAAYPLVGNKSGRLDMAIRLLKTDKHNSQVYYTEIGSARMSLGNEKEAVEAFQFGLECGNPVTWESTAFAAKQCGALGLLEALYSNTFKNNGNTRAGKILFDLRSAQDNASGMLQVAQKLVKLDPSDSTSALRLGEAYERNGLRTEAMKVYKKVASGSDDAAAAARSRINELGRNK